MSKVYYLKGYNYVDWQYNAVLNKYNLLLIVIGDNICSRAG